MALTSALNGSYQVYEATDFAPSFVLVNKRIPCLVKVAKIGLKLKQIKNYT